MNGTEEPSKPPTHSVDEYLWIYISPFILILGITGNSLIIAVVKRRERHTTSTSHVYLPVLAIADTATLVTGCIPEWLEACGYVKFKEISPWTCKMEKFVFYSSANVAVWILVAFTVDRFLAVTFELRREVMCTKKKARITCILILICHLSLNIHVFWTRGQELNDQGKPYKNCGKTDGFKYFETYMKPWFVFSLISAIPFCIIFLSNSMIVKKIVRAQRLRQQQRLVRGSKSSGLTQTTMMCLTASVTFLVCITPSIVLLIGRPYWSNKENSKYIYNMAKAINSQLMLINHSINFVLYCLTGQRFRSELVMMCRCSESPSANRIQFLGEKVIGITRTLVPDLPTSQNARPTGSTALGHITTGENHDDVNGSAVN